MKLPFVTRKEFEKTIGVEVGNRIVEQNTNPLSLFYTYHASLVQVIDSQKKRITDLENKLNRLLTHLDLVEKTIPGTPEKTVLEKKVSMDTLKSSIGGAGFGFGAVIAMPNLESIQPYVNKVTAPKRKRGRPRKS